MSWQKEVDELQRRMELAREMGGRANVERQHAAGRLTVRERVEQLLDPGSFHETGALAGRGTYDEQGNLTSFLPSNFVMGTGRIDGRRVVVGGDDFTVRGGAADASIAGKQGYAEKLALGLKLPMVRLVDGTGGGGSVKSLEIMGYTYVPANPSWDTVVDLVGEVPVVAACLGPVAGLGAVARRHLPFLGHGPRVSQLFIAGPPVVERGVGEKVTKEELGGTQIHARGSGAVDNEVETRSRSLRAGSPVPLRPAFDVWQFPPRAETSRRPLPPRRSSPSAIPRDRRRSYDVRRILNLVLDRESFFEMGRMYGGPLVVGLARLNGYPVGVMANDPKQGGGAVDAAAAEKMIRFIDLCDTFHLPAVNFVDNPGFLIGTMSEKAGTARVGARALMAVYQATVPWISIILRRVYGVAGAAHGNAQGLNLRYAWPSGDWGSLPIEGGVQAAYKREIEAAPDPAARRREIEERLQQYRSPFRTAEAFGVEEIIDPRDTRPLLCEWVETAYSLLPAELGPKRRKTRA